jgi:hypothetical protein
MCLVFLPLGDGKTFLLAWRFHIAKPMPMVILEGMAEPQKPNQVVLDYIYM